MIAKRVKRATQYLWNNEKYLLVLFVAFVIINSYLPIEFYKNLPLIIKVLDVVISYAFFILYFYAKIKKGKIKGAWRPFAIFILVMIIIALFINITIFIVAN